jgi:hypothetical protein
MTSFVDSHKMVVRKNAFSVHPMAQNQSEKNIFKIFLKLKNQGPT